MADDLDQAIVAAEETTRQLEWTKRLASAFDRIPGALTAASTAAGVDAEWACKTLGDILEQLADELEPGETIRLRKTGPTLLAAIPLEGRPWRHLSANSIEDAARLGEWIKSDDDYLRMYATIEDIAVDVRDVERGR